MIGSDDPPRPVRGHGVGREQRREHQRRVRQRRDAVQHRPRCQQISNTSTGARRRHTSGTNCDREQAPSPTASSRARVLLVVHHDRDDGHDRDDDREQHVDDQRRHPPPPLDQRIGTRHVTNDYRGRTVRSSDPGRTTVARCTTLLRRAVDHDRQPGRGARADPEDARGAHPRRDGGRRRGRGVARARRTGAAWRRRRPRPVTTWSRAAATVSSPRSRRSPPTPAAAWRSCRRARATTSPASSATTRSTRSSAFDVLDVGVDEVVDLGRVNGRWYTCVTASGFDAEANRWANTVQRISGTALYVAATIRTLAVYNPQPVPPDRRRRSRTSSRRGWSRSATVPRTRAACTSRPNASMHDGLLDVTVIGDALEAGAARGRSRACSRARTCRTPR